ncbi:DUF7512 family protein [Haloarcula pelagica]|nr:hypothetical protein [Halomicroarcula sp. YJ-61-S]
MFGLEQLSGTPQAVALVGLVLLEAVVLYVGYGELERALGPALLRAITER